MPDLALVLLVAAITFATRASYLLGGRGRRPPAPSPFLRSFPLALFVVLATTGLFAPNGRPEFSLSSVAASVGGVAGAVIFRRSIVGVVVTGAVAYWLARWATGG